MRVPAGYYTITTRSRAAAKDAAAKVVPDDQPWTLLEVAYFGQLVTYLFLIGEPEAVE